MNLEESLAIIETQKAALADITGQFDALKANQELLRSEAATAKEKAREKAELLATAKAEKALKDGDTEEWKRINQANLDALTLELETERSNSKMERLALDKANHERLVNSDSLLWNPVNGEAQQDIIRRNMSMSKISQSRCIKGHVNTKFLRPWCR